MTHWPDIRGLALVVGGARSGKSGFAHALAQGLALRVGEAPRFIATAQPLDEEMAERIRRHQQDRERDNGGEGWVAIEAPLALEAALAAQPPLAPLLVDCLTLWLSNLMGQQLEEARILGRVEALASLAAQRPGATLLVSNEVGQGIVPATPLGRAFRDLAGRANQLAAARAGWVFQASCGLVNPIKSPGQPPFWQVNQP